MVTGGHKARVRELSKIEQEDLLVRVIPAIAARYPNWQRLIVAIDGVDEMHENEAIARSMDHLRFKRVSEEGENCLAWSRE